MELDQLLDQAIALAYQKHHGQLDKAGHPYITHPLRVMNSLDQIELKIIAVLHDAIEDTDLTLANLSDLGFPPNIIAAINAITKQRGEDYPQYIERVKANPLALRVKIADMKDNMDLTRIPNPTEKDLLRHQKYQTILPQLEATLNLIQEKS